MVKSWSVNGCNDERLATLESERSNALERTMKNIYDMLVFLFQKLGPRYANLVENLAFLKIGRSCEPIFKKH